MELYSFATFLPSNGACVDLDYYINAEGCPIVEKVWAVIIGRPLEDITQEVSRHDIGMMEAEIVTDAWAGLSVQGFELRDAKVR